jgi:hypothetical protein
VDKDIVWGVWLMANHFESIIAGIGDKVEKEDGSYKIEYDRGSNH